MEAAEATPEAPRPAYIRVVALLFLSIIAVILVVYRHAYWAPALVLVELLANPLRPVWAALTRSVDHVRLVLAPLKRFPGAIVGIPLLFLGLALGLLAPQTFHWLGDGVAATVKFLAKAAPYVIFFTLTPSIAATLVHGRAGKFALWVSASYLIATWAAGLLAILVAVPVFGVRLFGSGGNGGGANLIELSFTTPAFIAIFIAVGLGLMIYGFALGGLRDATRFVGNKVIDLVGDLLKIGLPLVLFSLGVFIPTTVQTGINRAKSAGLLEGVGWVGHLNPTVAYFATVAVLVVVLAIWIGAGGYFIMKYTRFPLPSFFRDYFIDVYSYAWATSSSSASIPINLERTGSALKVRSNIREFIIPLGATVHLDGTMISAIVTAVAACQLVGYTPTVLDLLLLLIPLSIITHGTPGIPGGLAIVAAPVLAQVLPLPPGTEAAFTAIFIGFNIGLSDQFRTGVNAVGNGILCRLFEFWYPTKFEKGLPEHERLLMAATPPGRGATTPLENV